MSNAGVPAYGRSQNAQSEQRLRSCKCALFRRYPARARTERRVEITTLREIPRALITGITGQDGSYLTPLLLDRGYEVVGMVRSGGVRIDGARTVGGDLADPASLRAAVLETMPDELYHLAAPTFVPASWEDPAGTLALVAGATGTLLQAAHETSNGMRVLVASSGEIFGAAARSPQDERTPMRPRSPYGVAKLAAYGLVDVLRSRLGLHASSAIAYNHESPRRPERFLPRKVCRGAAAIKLGLTDTLVLGDMDAVRDWCHARDVVRGYWLMLQQDEPGDVILAGGAGRTVGDLVDAAFAVVGLDPADHVRVDPALVRPAEGTPPVGDITLARTRLGWEPETSFEAMIEEMVRADLADLQR
ncbi:MAG: GDPmannose 4,6-dehydratase [Solirubrobacteraceae bacterium]|nr:GDPmannose 4,6-dehydratase [Solirubrobacteraceae bacterium]